MSHCWLGHRVHSWACEGHWRHLWGLSQFDPWQECSMFLCSCTWCRRWKNVTCGPAQAQPAQPASPVAVSFELFFQLCIFVCIFSISSRFLTTCTFGSCFFMVLKIEFRGVSTPDYHWAQSWIASLKQTNKTSLLNILFWAISNDFFSFFSSFFIIDDWTQDHQHSFLCFSNFETRSS